MNSSTKKLLLKLKKKKAMIGIVGLGYVGLNLLLNLSKKNFNIIGYDVDRNKIKKLQKSESTISYIKDTSIKKTKKNVTYSIEFNDLNICDIIIVCLPTPLKSNKYPIEENDRNLRRHKWENGNLNLPTKRTHVNENQIMT